MIDPISGVGVATAAFNGIKQAVALGKDIQDMSGQLGQWSKAISDINFAAEQDKKPPWWKKLGGGHQANAVESWMQKKKVDEMREELRSYISLYYGPSAWKEIVHIETQMRKEQKEREYAAIERKQAIMEWLVGIGLFVTTVALLVGFVWIFNQAQ